MENISISDDISQVHFLKAEIKYLIMQWILLTYFLMKEDMMIGEDEGEIWKYISSKQLWKAHLSL